MPGKEKNRRSQCVCYSLAFSYPLLTQVSPAKEVAADVITTPVWSPRRKFSRPFRSLMPIVSYRSVTTCTSSGIPQSSVSTAYYLPICKVAWRYLTLSSLPRICTHVCACLPACLSMASPADYTSCLEFLRSKSLDNLQF